MKTKSIIIPFCFIAILLSLLCACSKTVESGLIQNENNIATPGVVSVEDAIKNLNAFLAETQMTKTAGGEERVITSVEPHYSSRSNSNSPDAYLVNFDGENGFAILGANSDVAPIIAVIEEGNTDWESIMSADLGSIKNKQQDGMNSFEDTILTTGIPPECLLKMCVVGALYGVGEEEEYESTKSYTINISPLLGSNFDFGQNITYCHKDNDTFVINGCASTAISMIMAYNNYPNLSVDFSALNYSNCNTENGAGYMYSFSNGTNYAWVYVQTSDYFTNSSSIPSNLTEEQKLNLITLIDSGVINSHGTPAVSDNVSFFRTRYMLTSAVFYELDNIIKRWDGTGTMPAAVVNGLEDLGYTNVSKVRKQGLSSGQISTIISMLSAGKPVLMCGWSLFDLPDSHYWVVDGVRQNSSETLIHCNWGWLGSYNGWFASDCIRPENPVPLNNSGTGDAWNNIIVFSYDMAATIPNVVICDFYLSHRATY